MHRKDQSQTNNKGTGRDAAIQIINNHNVINTAAVVLRSMRPSQNTLIEFLSPFALSALFLAFFF